MAKAKTTNPTATIYLDSRKGRAKKNGRFTVKLRVYNPLSRKEKHYKTPFEFDKSEFDRVWHSTKPRGNDRDQRTQLQELQARANKVANELANFSFEAFEAHFFGTHQAQGHDVFSYYRKKINELRKAERHGSADSYQCSANAIQNYLAESKGHLPQRLDFEEITPEFLESFEGFITQEKGLSLSTAGVYTRQLRAIFNDALEAEITKNYPFGRRRYKTPSAKRAKKALNADQLRQLSEANPANEHQQTAKDFWLLSFCLYGINVKDLAELRNRDISETHLTYYRGKTLKTSKSNLTPITVPLTDKAKAIIERYKTRSLDPESHVFDIINQADSSDLKKRKVQNFTRFINQHIKLLAQANGLPSELSYQWARHTFATLSIRQGASMEFVSEALGHHNLSTTQAYFQGFDKETGKQIMEQLTNF